MKFIRLFILTIITFHSFFSDVISQKIDSSTLNKYNNIFKKIVQPERKGDYYKSIDLLHEEYKLNDDIGIRALILREIGGEYLNAGEIDSSEVYINKSIYLFRKYNLNEYELQKTNFSLGNIAQKKFKYKEAMKYYIQSYNFFQEKDKDLTITICNNIAQNLINLGDFENALTYLKKSEEYAIQLNDNSALVVVHISMANLEYYRSNKLKLDKSIFHTKLALEYAEKTKKQKYILTSKLNLGAYLLKNNNLPEARKVLKEVEGNYKINKIKSNVLNTNLFKLHVAYNELDSAKYYFSFIKFDELDDNELEYYLLLKESLIKDPNLKLFNEIEKVKKWRDSIKTSSMSIQALELERKFKISQKQIEIENLKNKFLSDQIKLKNISIENLAKEKQNIELLNQKKLDQAAINETNLLNKQKEAENQTLKTEQSLHKAKLSSQNKMLLGGGIGLGVISLLSLLLYRQSHKRKLMNETLRQQKDKIQLLNRELNHRVKNNLAFMTSLLEMQGRRTESAETKQALIESESRLKALALVHSQLFRSDTDTEVNLKNYLEEIKEHLLGIFSIPDKELNIETDFCDYTINAEDAMRLGLIVNELVTNSVKHAFTDIENPKIAISTKISAEGKLALNYSDNGPGISKTVSENIKETSLGIKLIDLLRKQLGDRYVVVV